MFHIKTFEYDLCYNEVYVLLLQLYFFEKLKKSFFSYGSLPISFSS